MGKHCRVLSHLATWAHSKGDGNWFFLCQYCMHNEQMPSMVCLPIGYISVYSKNTKEAYPYHHIDIDTSKNPPRVSMLAPCLAPPRSCDLSLSSSPCHGHRCPEAPQPGDDPGKRRGAVPAPERDRGRAGRPPWCRACSGALYVAESFKNCGWKAMKGWNELTMLIVMRFVWEDKICGEVSCAVGEIYRYFLRLCVLSDHPLPSKSNIVCNSTWQACFQHTEIHKMTGSGISFIMSWNL